MLHFKGLNLCGYLHGSTNFLYLWLINTSVSPSFSPQRYLPTYLPTYLPSLSCPRRSHPGSWTSWSKFHLVLFLDSVSVGRLGQFPVQESRASKFLFWGIYFPWLQPRYLGCLIFRWYGRVNEVVFCIIIFIIINPYPANVDNMASSYQC